jgi:hypothetical protein
MQLPGPISLRPVVLSRLLEGIEKKNKTKKHLGCKEKMLRVHGRGVCQDLHSSGEMLVQGTSTHISQLQHVQKGHMPEYFYR